MTETPDSTPAAPSGGKKRGGGLSSMLLADLKSMAAGLGVAGAGSMKKAQLVEAIKAVQSGGAGQSGGGKKVASRQDKPEAVDTSASAGEKSDADKPREDQLAAEKAASDQATRDKPAAEKSSADKPAVDTPAAEKSAGEKAAGETESQDQGKSRQEKRDRSRQQGGQGRDSQQESQQKDKGGQDKSGPDKGGPDKGGPDKGGPQRQDRQGQQGQNQQGQQGQGQQGPDQDDDGEGGSRRNRRRRGRDRQQARVGGRNEPDTSILEDDVLVPAAGILDVLDNYAFVRTSGYLPGTDDVYLSLSMVRKYGLRRGDAIVGQVRQPREGERREKFNPMVRIDSVNGADPEAAKERPDFAEATPVHPAQRLRLSTDPANVIGRVLDVVTPIGKGQRGLVYAPPASGTTALLQSIATSVTTNNPECHLMVVLVDERPEEVTDFQRSVKGEVIASTFDRQPADHVMVAELSIERAKRLVELGHDVVVLLDSLTRLGRAYNLVAPANGRVLAAGVDASAVHPPKQFFGAARNIEDGGSLTILAVVADTASPTDLLFLEELVGTANMELRLSPERAASGLVPAVDPGGSGTRHEELLLAPAEAAVVTDVRRKLAEATTQGALEKVVAGR